MREIVEYTPVSPEDVRRWRYQGHEKPVIGLLEARRIAQEARLFEELDVLHHNDEDLSTDERLDAVIEILKRGVFN